MVGEFALGCQIIKDKNALLQIILYSVLTWALIVAMNYPFYYVFDLETKTLGLSSHLDGYGLYFDYRVTHSRISWILQRRGFDSFARNHGRSRSDRC